MMDPLKRKTKIVCTIGPSTSEPEVMRQLIRTGMDVARLNFSHGDAETHRQSVDRLRAAAKAEQKTVTILADLQGPKLRMGSLPNQGVRVQAGERVMLTTDEVISPQSNSLPVGEKTFPTLVKPGDRILIDDGNIELSTEKVNGNEVETRVVVGGTIRSHKGINLPGLSTHLPAITDKDREDVLHAVEWGADWVALSFVHSSAEVEELRRFMLSQTGKSLPIMAKIERQAALDHIDEIIASADGIMVARGDLGIEIPAEKVPMAQKYLIKHSNEAGIPVVTATQMLDSMVRNPRPTRAETSDVANAILDGTDAVMLSAETAVGNYPVQTVETMVRIICEVENKQVTPLQPPYKPAGEGIHHSIAQAIASSTREAVENLDVAAIIAITASGYTARLVSRYRPQAPILAVSPDELVVRRLGMYWGVRPLVAPRTHNTDEMIANALSITKERNFVKSGDLVVITAGTAGSEAGTTNFLQIRLIQ